MLVYVLKILTLIWFLVENERILKFRMFLFLLGEKERGRPKFAEFCEFFFYETFEKDVFHHCKKNNF